ncbi:MAG: molybdopterin-guanine dinucleotide biosynthesis protein B [Candidatus Hodarchaeales archaeon]
MFTVIGIVGTRNTGKTTSLINLAKRLTEEGFHVAIMKFMSHKFDLNDETKDSSRFREANSSIIISASPSETVTYQPRAKRASLEELLPLVPKNTDFILCEGIPVDAMANNPVIFCCRDNDTYTELKSRYKNIKPIYISGLIANNDIQSLDNIPVVSTLNEQSLKRMVDKFKKIREDELNYT